MPEVPIKDTPESRHIKEEKETQDEVYLGQLTTELSDNALQFLKSVEEAVKNYPEDKKSQMLKAARQGVAQNLGEDILKARENQLTLVLKSEGQSKLPSST